MIRIPVLRAVLTTAVLAVLTGLAYPLAVTGLAHLAFRTQAEGSLVYREGRAVGSALVGQRWQGPEWFHGRPSAAGYDAAASSGSNLGPTSRRLAELIRERIRAILELEGPYNSGLRAADIPVDLLTASASGLDPHISPAAAELQAPRIAAVQGIPLREIRRLIAEHTEGRTVGLLGEPRVNVLELNLALEGVTG